MLRFALVSILAVLCLPSSASAALSTSHSGWFWGTPEPQGHDLTAIDFQGNTGYAAGEFGTLLATDDAGNTWRTIRTGTTLNFTRLDVIDTDSLVVGSECVLRRSDDGGSTFRELPYTSRCASRLRAVSFPSLDIGYLLLEDSGVLKTTDGGQSFSSLTTVPADPAGGSTAIAFSDNQNGLLTTATGDIYRTVNGGDTWTREYDGQPRLLGLYVAGAGAVAVGASGTYLTSSDGGDTWSQRSAEPGAPPTPTQDFLSVRCSPSGVCLVVTNEARLFRTTDTGRSFEPVDSGTVQAVDFSSASRAVAVGAGGRTFISDDSGSNFVVQGTRLPGSIQVTRIRATSSAVAHIAGLPRVIGRTTDGGETWVAIGVPTNRDIVDVAFPTAGLGFALDQGGALFRTDNGGASWRVVDVDVSQPPQAVYSPDGRVVLLVGLRGMLRSTDGGRNFTRVQHEVVRIRTLMNADRAGSATLAYGPRVIAVSTNRGRTWRRIVRPTQKAEVAGADFVSAERGYVVETDGRMYTTGNAGRTWTEVVGAGRPVGPNVAFSTRRNGWVSLGSFPSTVMRTTDGGRSWHPQLIGDAGAPVIAAPTPNVGFAAFGGFGEPGVVFTRTGGDAGADSRLTISTPQRVLSRSRTITINGRLTPVIGGEQVEVWIRSLNRRDWRTERAPVASDGTFSIRHRVRRATVFVAQWAGHTRTAGDGSPPLIVRIGSGR